MILQDEAIRNYIEDIGEFVPLTKQEEADLGARSMAGDLAARNELVRRNLFLVMRIAKTRCGRGLEFLDLIQEGNIGLMRAAELFNPALGFRFTTYASTSIKRYIQRGIMDQGATIRIPVYKGLARNRAVLAGEDRGLPHAFATPSESLEDVPAPESDALAYNPAAVVAEIVEAADLDPVLNDLVVSRLGLGDVPAESDRKIARRHGKHEQWPHLTMRQQVVPRLRAAAILAGVTEEGLY